jgi:hypothetical protein
MSKTGHVHLTGGGVESLANASKAFTSILDPPTAEVVHAAVLAERARCAKIAENELKAAEKHELEIKLHPSWGQEYDTGMAEGEASVAESILARIRSGETT